MSLTRKPAETLDQLEETEQPQKQSKTKKGGGKKELTPAQLVAAQLEKDTKASFEGEVIFDPDAPLATADKWIPMPHPWQELTGVKGVPMGHVTTIQGKQDCGKTTIAMHAMVEAQEMGYNVIVIDTEYKFNKQRLANMGMDITNVFFAVCETVEQGFDAIDNLIEKYEKITPGVPCLFVWDSLGMTPTDAELKGVASAMHVASAAKVIKKNLRRQVAKIHSRDVAIIFINHLYDNINAMFGGSTKGYGGNGPYFASVICIDVAKVGAWAVQKDKKKVVLGLKSKLKCTKNHMSAVQGMIAEVKIGSMGIDGSGSRLMEDEEGGEGFAEEDFDVPKFQAHGD